MSPRVFKKPNVGGRALRVSDAAPASKASPTSPVPAPLSPEAVRAIEEECRRRWSAENDARRHAEDKEREAAVLEERRRWFAAQEAPVIDLVLKIAAKVCRLESTRPEVAAAWVREGLQRLSAAGPRTVSVHPQDAAAVRALEEAQRPGVTIEESVDREPGDAVIETPTVRYDARLSTRLEEVERPLRALSEGSGDD